MEKIICVNKKARHEYFLFDTLEAGLALQGTEIKSIRKGNVNLKDSFIDIHNLEAFIKNMHIAIYEFGNRFNHEEKRDRKLLLHKDEILKLQQKVQVKGFTIIPTKLYFSKGKVKLEIALAKGKDLHDKRDSLKEQDAKREIEKAMKIR